MRTKITSYKKLILLFTFCLIIGTSYAKTVIFYDENNSQILLLDDINRVVKCSKIYPYPLEIYDSTNSGNRLILYCMYNFSPNIPGGRFCFEIDSEKIVIYSYDSIGQQWIKLRTYKISNISEN